MGKNIYHEIGVAQPRNIGNLEDWGVLYIFMILLTRDTYRMVELQRYVEYIMWSS